MDAQYQDASCFQQPLFERLRRPLRFLSPNALPSLLEMHSSIPQQLRPRLYSTILPLILWLIPQHAQVNIMRQVLAPRDLLHARLRKYPPHQLIRLLLLLIGTHLLRLTFQRQKIERRLCCVLEAEAGFCAPVLVQNIETEDVLLPVLCAVEACAVILEHAQPLPCQDLGDILHDGLRWNLEIPSEFRLLGFLEGMLGAEGDKWVVD